jgi:hypothetical protein
MDAKRIGQRTSWISGRGFGFLTALDGETLCREKFYAHVSRLISGKPELNARYKFDVLRTTEGANPSAINIEAIDGGAR